MRLIGTLPNEAEARRFCDYLLTLKIDAHAEEQASDGAWQVWIEHDDHLDAGRAELQQFQSAPGDAKYGSAAAAAKKLRDSERKRLEQKRTQYRDVRTTWASAAMGRYATPVAVTLIFLTLAVAALTRFGYDRKSPVFQALLFDNPWRNVSAEGEPVAKPASMFTSLQRGEVWRAVTPIFIHFGPFHLVFNMLWLWRLGQVIESRIGSVRFGLMVLLIAALSCLAQALWKDYSLFGGMSGVVAGLFGYAWMKHKYQPYEGIHVTDFEVGYMLVWLIVCSLGFVGPIANAAHWGGLAIGMVLALVPVVRRRYFPGR